MDRPVEYLIRDARMDTVVALREYAERRLSFALRPFNHHVAGVTLRLVDVNGPRRGVDSRCSIEARLDGGGRLFVDATEAWPFAAVTEAARRLSEAIRRHVTRHSRHTRLAVRPRRGRSRSPDA